MCMSRVLLKMPDRHLQGFTLIELVVFIVVVSIGLVGILSVMNVTTMHSADPLVRKQAAALAESILEEVLLKSYADPDGGANVVEAGGRAEYDDVDDYNGLTQTAFTDLPAGLSAYTVSIAVGAAAAVSGESMKKVTVTVTRGSESVAMVGYRADFCTSAGLARPPCAD